MIDISKDGSADYTGKVDTLHGTNILRFPAVQSEEVLRVAEYKGEFHITQKRDGVTHAIKLDSPECALMVGEALIKAAIQHSGPDAA